MRVNWERRREGVLGVPGEIRKGGVLGKWIGRGVLGVVLEK
jgi:hypothetical protein